MRMLVTHLIKFVSYFEIPCTYSSRRQDLSDFQVKNAFSGNIIFIVCSNQVFIAHDVALIITGARRLNVFLCAVVATNTSKSLLKFARGSSSSLLTDIFCRI
jgi:hypothetical protein